MAAIDSTDEIRRLDRLPVRRVFDSADCPLPAGVRRRDVTSRHMLYEAERLCLDLRLERDPKKPDAVLVGQLANLDDPMDPLVGLPVLLTSGEAILIRTRTNRHGEFQIEYRADASMSLCLPTADGRLIELPVDGETTRPPEPG